MIVTLEITAGFKSDARLSLRYRDCYGAQHESCAWSWPCLQEDNYYNRKYELNLTKTNHAFELDIPDGSEILYEQSFVDFGFTGRLYDWVGPGIVKSIPLNQLMVTNNHH